MIPPLNMRISPRSIHAIMVEIVQLSVYYELKVFWRFSLSGVDTMPFLHLKGEEILRVATL